LFCKATTRSKTWWNTGERMADCNHNAHGHQANTQRLLWALAVILVFMVVEVIGGVISGSLALLADAAHMLTDGFALALAASAQIFAVRPADAKLHFGYRRAQVLAAFVNGVLMAVLLVWIVYEAIKRFINPPEVDSSLMFWVAVAGLVANIVAFAILHRRHEKDVNMRGALLHVIGDLLGSVAAIAAAIVIGLTGWMPIDPLLSLAVALLIGVSAVRLIRETAHILLEGAPENIDVRELSDGLKKAAPVIMDVHHVQIWQITPENPRLTLHACVKSSDDTAAALEAAKEFLEQKYHIRQSTIQVEIGVECCPDRGHAKDVKRAASNEKHSISQPVATVHTLAAQEQ
jgi:cobalt-zinc-cadmium efflux system protein